MMCKRHIFTELMEGFDALASERESKTTLKKRRSSISRLRR